MHQARFEDRGAGLARLSEGWFVLNVADAEWLTSETSGPKQPSGAECSFETRHVSFPQIGVRLHVLEPGESNGLYHRESEQEDFLVLSGECRLLVEGAERILRAWDFFHSPAGTEHIFLGAGDEPCVILMAGARSGAWKAVYPVSELAARYGASAQKEPTDPDEAYAAGGVCLAPVEPGSFRFERGADGAEAGALEPGAEVRFLPRVAQAHEARVGGAFGEEAADRLRAADRHDRDALGVEVATVADGQSLEGALVADPLDEEDAAHRT